MVLCKVGKQAGTVLWKANDTFLCFHRPLKDILHNLSGLQRIYKAVGVPMSASATGWTCFIPVLSVHPILVNAKAWKGHVGMSSNLAQMSADSEGLS